MEKQSPPVWLITALTDLQKSYTSDRFEGTMRYIAYDPVTDLPVQPNTPNAPQNLKFKWTPRIRCHDCPGKLYTPGPEKSAENFLMHLKNRGHRCVVFILSSFLTRL
jgi:SWI/SNF-related matrix-associated actin-dependent regulator of chromatin subfamily B protein 1